MTLPPYADFLGLRIVDSDPPGGVRTLVMPFDASQIGRPGFLHGGVIGGLLEMAAVVALADTMETGIDSARLKPINVTVDFMRGGRERDTYASGLVTRLGTRVANVEASAWQDDPARPIATARMNYLLSR